jgi:hypothetical protein
MKYLKTMPRETVCFLLKGRNRVAKFNTPLTLLGRREGKEEESLIVGSWQN